MNRGEARTRGPTADSEARSLSHVVDQLIDPAFRAILIVVPVRTRELGMGALEVEVNGEAIVVAERLPSAVVVELLEQMGRGVRTGAR